MRQEAGASPRPTAAEHDQHYAIQEAVRNIVENAARVRRLLCRIDQRTRSAERGAEGDAETPDFR